MPDLSLALEKARVPEHSVPFMEAMSQGTAFMEGDYLFLTADDWLMAVAYPLAGDYAHDAFERALRAALRRVPKRLDGVDCWAVGPELPPRLAGHVSDSGQFLSACPPTRPCPPACAVRWPAPPSGSRCARAGTSPRPTAASGPSSWAVPR